MKCPQCGQDNPSSLKFCGECGARLVALCPACGAQNSLSQKFCGACGERLLQARAEAKFASPDSYTPKHLADRILTSKAALEGERKPYRDGPDLHAGSRRWDVCARGGRSARPGCRRRSDNLPAHPREQLQWM